MHPFAQSPSRSISRALVVPILGLTSLIAFPFCLADTPSAPVQATTTERRAINLSGQGWQFAGVPEKENLPALGSEEFKNLAWKDVTVPHVFQTRDHFNDLTKGWYRRTITVDPNLKGKELYLVFEGVATITDVFVNGQHLGQHRGAYTRFVVDATKALHSGSDNELVVAVDDSRKSMTDCLPCSDGLYKVWGGLYRKVWLVALDPLHIDPTDDGAPGVYLTPKNVTEESADLKIRVLLRNTAKADAQAEVRVQVIDPDGKEVATLSAPAHVPSEGRAQVELSTTIAHPQLWEPLKGRLYQVRTSLYREGKMVDAVTESTGFRTVSWDWKNGKVTINGKPVTLIGANLHQETEPKASALSDEDLRGNFDNIKDLGMNFLRLPHYPHARLEYDLCDRNGILCWAENGNSQRRDVPGATPAQITTEMVKQNYNHPSIVLWSVGNEASAETADQCVPIVRALDPLRPVVVANMKSNLADLHGRNSYPGWYQDSMRAFKPEGFYSEIGAGGVVTTHCDYNQSDWKVDSYEPEEYQQLVAENHFQEVFRGENSHLGMFCWWVMRDFNDAKYKKSLGINSKGLLTYAGDKKDIYYLLRSFLRPEEPTVWIASKRYFLRQGAVDNGIKVYSNAKKVTLTLNGEKVSTLDNGQYVIPDGPWAHHPPIKSNNPGAELPAPEPSPSNSGAPKKIENVFYWPVSLRTGKNIVTATDDQSHSDSAVIYYEGAKDNGTKGQPELPPANAPLKDLASSNAQNPARYIDDAVHAQWPTYTDLDSTADNSWDAIPEELKDATWIALRRVSKPENATDLSFTLTRPMKVYIASSRNGAPVDEWAKSGFKKFPSSEFKWRDNALMLVPAELFLHEGKEGETITIPLGKSDAVVLLKE